MKFWSPLIVIWMLVSLCASAIANERCAPPAAAGERCAPAAAGERCAPAATGEKRAPAATGESAIGKTCTEEPSCRVVGETHMLVWTGNGEPRDFVVCVHGLGLCARAYKALAEELKKAGVSGFAVNVRGFGPDRDKPGYKSLNLVDTVEDVSHLLTQIKREHAKSRVFLMGESMGGALAIRVAAEHPELIDGLICSAPAWRILKLKRTAIKGIVEVFLVSRKRPGPAGRSILEQATSKSELAEHVLSDPSHRLKLSVGDAVRFLRFTRTSDRYARKLTCPILVIQGLNDHLVNPVAVAKLVARIPSESKVFLVDAEAEHLVLEEGQFSPELVSALEKWIAQNDELRNDAKKTFVLINESNLGDSRRKLLRKLRRASSMIEDK